METNNDITISLSIDAFTLGDQRETHIRMTHGEIDDNERSASANSEAARSRHTTFRDFSGLLGTSRKALPHRSRPPADRGFHRNAQPTEAPVPHGHRRFGRKPPHLFRGRAQPPLRRNDPAGITSEGHGTPPPKPYEATPSFAIGAKRVSPLSPVSSTEKARSSILIAFARAVR